MKKSRVKTRIFLCLFLMMSLKGTAQDIVEKMNEFWDVPYLDAARYESYLTDNEKDLILELNLVRTNPARYAELFLRPLLKKYNGKLFTYPGDAVPLKTEEGISALKECIRVLEKTKGVGMLHPSRGLSNAASDHAKEQSRNGKVGHHGKRKSTPFKRMSRYGEWRGMAAENIDYGNETARWVVISLLIDDGVPERGHRTNILFKDLGSVGVAFDTHPKYKYMCVMDFAGSFEERK